MFEVEMPSRRAFLALGSLLLWSASAGADESEIGRLLQGRDLAGAVEAARRDAEAGDPEAQFNFALFHWHGVAVPQNFNEAFRWVTLAAIGGYPRAPKARAAMQETVDPPARKKAMEWIRSRLQKAAEEGDDRALVLMSLSHAPEYGFPDAKDAYFWASLAVAAGRMEARRRRDALLKDLSPAEAAGVQERASEWFRKWRKVKS